MYAALKPLLLLQSTKHAVHGSSRTEARMHVAWEQDPFMISLRLALPAVTIVKASAVTLLSAQLKLVLNGPINLVVVAPLVANRYVYVYDFSVALYAYLCDLYAYLCDFVIYSL